MKPAAFPETNTIFGPPPGLAESQVHSIPAYAGDVHGGSCDGLKQVVVAYYMTPEELAYLAEGNPLFLTVMGGLPPHFLSFSFEQATHPK